MSASSPEGVRESARKRWAVVTGASSGIGLAIASRLLNEGHGVLPVARREAPLRQLAIAYPGRVTPVVADLADPYAYQMVARHVEGLGGRFYGLVNCAGLARFGELRPDRISDMDAMYAVNLRAPAALIAALRPALERDEGAVVNVTSIGGVMAMPGRALYGATKAAVNSLTRSLAVEFAPRVRVNAVVPGAVDTPMYDDLGLDEERTRQLREGLRDTTPAARFGEPGEIAQWVCRLLDPQQSSWVTGSLFIIDGGRSA